MIAVLLIVIPLLTGLAAFLIKNEKAVRSWALFSSIVTLIVSLVGLTILKEAKWLEHQSAFMSTLGSSFSVKLDGMGQLLCLLNTIAFPLIFISTWNSAYKKPNSFFALMLLSQAGMMGVFLAMDALLFYFFWELALIPVYFLCSQWGGEKRIAVTFKFFIYTFVGSLLMLVGILFIYAKTPDHSFAIQSFYTTGASLTNKDQTWLFWLFFIAFAVKMPIFPFHTWQPDTYEQSPTATTMVLSGVMVKMGVLGVIRWLLPVLPIASYSLGDRVSWLAVIGMIYASLIAIKQDDIKRLVAYSSIAHIGLMCVAIFSENKLAMQGVMIQMFNHGINIIGLWIVVELIERQFGTRKLSELGGLAQKAPSMAILFVIIALANIALPLTNAFIGEFLMFSGIFGSQVTKLNVWFTVLAGICIILAAIYTLNLVRKIFYGDAVARVANAQDVRLNEKLALGAIVILIFWMGVYPQSVLNITNEISDSILKISDVRHLLTK
ncbi:complex I subunit 4 family protein [Terrimonas pollutisoli]|uniref:complex I subunit 4 family protein n=1 Tax=Terrimonas pollutisoli TaxID=3034147 RepID=UPI0023EBBE5E|nr:NADH-quinone oxidoreductase subunit M [Terrimonas sp. H1YJ31]